MTKTVKASDFEANCLALMDEVIATGETIIVTKDGEPVAQFGPPQAAEKPALYGLLKGRIKIVGDIMSPLDVEWDAMK